MTLRIIVLLTALITITSSNLYAQEDNNVKLQGIVKRSSLVTVSKNQDGINYFHNSKQGTRIIVNSKTFEYHSPGKFKIPLDKKRHLVTIQTI